MPVGKNEKGKVIKHEIKFLYSFKFMASSLDALVGNLEEDQLIQTKRIFGERADLLSRKGVYPYDWMDSFEKFNEVLPEKSDFYSKLNKDEISEKDYQHACKVWKEFGMKNMGEYHDLYLKTNVTLLADVFEAFRKPCLRDYGLDPCWYLTAPAFAWDSMLKMTRVKLELLKDSDMHQFFEKQIRGGVSTAFHRFAKENNKYMKYFDETQPSNFITYFDANSLYPTAMLEPLPVGNFAWMRKNELEKWEEFVEKEDVGCVLEVDLEYPAELHDDHNDYPLAPESLEMGGVKKLIPNFMDKKSMVLHGKSLQQYLSLGMKLKKIHRGIKFREEAFMKPFIELNTKLRTAAKNDFEKNFFKLISNSVYGKTLENVRNRVKVYIVNDEKQKRRLTSQPHYKHSTHFNENLAAVHMGKLEVRLNKPVYCGAAILDLSKHLMFSFHYEYAKKKWKGLKVLYTDTDSLIYNIPTEDVFADTAGDAEKWFDTSGYPKDHPSCIPVGKNKKVLEVFKDECGGKIISEFVGLRAKCYSIKMDGGSEKKNMQGCKKECKKRNHA